MSKQNQTLCFFNSTKVLLNYPKFDYTNIIKTFFVLSTNQFSQFYYLHMLSLTNFRCKGFSADSLLGMRPNYFKLIMKKSR